MIKFFPYRRDPRCLEKDVSDYRSSLRGKPVRTNVTQELSYKVLQFLPSQGQYTFTFLVVSMFFQDFRPEGNFVHICSNMDLR